MPGPTQLATACGSTTELLALPLPRGSGRSTKSCIVPVSRQRLMFDLRFRDSSAVLSVVTASLNLTGAVESGLGPSRRSCSCQ